MCSRWKESEARVRWVNLALQVGSDVATQEPLWELSFGGETVETFVARPADEAVQSPVRILPDRSDPNACFRPSMIDFTYLT